MGKDYPDYDIDRFKADTTEHKLTILHDDGLYRHLRCKQPGTGFYWFDLITWPGHLAIGGDFGNTLVFARDRDMFAFFRSRSGRINPGYWQEKLTTGRDSVKRYSPDLFRQLVDEDVADAVEHDPDLAEVDDEHVGLVQAVNDALTDEYNWEYEDGAREFLRDFTYEYAPRTVDDPAGPVQVGNALAEALGMPSAATITAVKAKAKTATWGFTDAWEWDLTDWDWTYLWACHAIVWGISQYDQEKAAAPTVDTEGLVRTAIADPGQFCTRKRRRDHDDEPWEYETVPAWGARAVMIALGKTEPEAKPGVPGVEVVELPAEVPA